MNAKLGSPYRTTPIPQLKPRQETLTPEVTTTNEVSRITPPVVNTDPSEAPPPMDLQTAMEILARNGYEVASPKKKYVKHSYEIETELFDRFHEMFPTLGFKTVKSAVNDALQFWCDIHEKDYQRKKGSA